LLHDRRQVAVTDGFADPVLERDGLEDVPEPDFVASVWRRGEPEHLRVAEVLDDVAVRARRRVVSLVDHDGSERITGPALEAASLHRLDARDDDVRAEETSIGRRPRVGHLDLAREPHRLERVLRLPNELAAVSDP